MDHDTIVRSHTLERYFLGELPPPEREEFEEHAADCPVCMRGLEDLDLFTANAAAVFRDEETARAREAERKASKSNGWFSFLRPTGFPALAFSGALNLALLVFAGYGLMQRSGSSVETIDEVVVRPPARTGETQVCSVGKSAPVSLRFDLPNHYAKYSYSLEGAKPGSADVKVPDTAETITLRISLAGLKAGDHLFKLSGWDGQNPIEIGECLIRVEP